MAGGADPFKIPDYRIYKVDGIPELERTRELLARKGLKDPWLRNEVWRYHPDNYKGMFNSMVRSIGRGFKWGAGAFVLAVIGEKLYHKANPDTSQDHH